MIYVICIQSAKPSCVCTLYSKSIEGWSITGTPKLFIYLNTSGIRFIVLKETLCKFLIGLFIKKKYNYYKSIIRVIIDLSKYFHGYTPIPELKEFMVLSLFDQSVIRFSVLRYIYIYDS